MKLKKWNYLSHEYKEIEVPDLNYKKFSYDMDELCNCPHCFKEVKVGETYTSMEFHDELGLGYCVCEKCYNEEWQRRNKFKGD